MPTDADPADPEPEIATGEPTAPHPHQGSTSSAMLAAAGDAAALFAGAPIAGAADAAIGVGEAVTDHPSPDRVGAPGGTGSLTRWLILAALIAAVLLALYESRVL